MSVNEEKTPMGSQQYLSSSVVSIPPPSPVCLAGDVLENWTFFKLQYTNYAIATGLDKKPAEIQVATFLSVIGRECLKIFTRLDIEETDKSDVKKILEALDKHFEPESNVIYERFVFGSASQEINESIDQYVCRLRHLASNCKYGALESELIRDRLVLGVSDISLRKKLLGNANLTLSTAIDASRALEATNKQFKKMSNQNEDEEMVNKTSDMQGRTNTYQNNRNKPCIYCGKFHVWKKSLCPAFGKKCQNCGKQNHFSNVCKQNKSKTSFSKPKSNSKYSNSRQKNTFKRNLHQVGLSNESSSEDDESQESLYTLESLFNGYLNTCSGNPKSKKQWYTEIELSCNSQFSAFKCQLDTGSTSNVINIRDYSTIVSEHSPSLKPSILRLKCYDGKIIKPLGQQTLQCMYDKRCYNLLFQVVKTPSYQKPLLSAEACEELGLIEVKANLCHMKNVSNPWSKEDIFSQYGDVFKGLGKLPGLYHLEIDQSAVPVKHAPRRIPIPLKKKLKEKLLELESKNIIKKESNPTEWISSMVVVVRNDKIRICIDPKDLNLALRRSHYQIPTIEEMLPNLAKAKVFTSLDAKDGYWQVELDEPSSKLTTFWTPEGRYRWLRLPFGIAPAAEEFQRRLHETLDGIEGVCVIADDILVYGCGDSYHDAVNDHDRKLRLVLERARKYNLKLNKSKSKLREKELAYMGHVLTQNGLKPDDSKIHAIQKMAKPENLTDLQRFLGLVTYLAKFVPALSERCEVLRQLSQKDVPWTWDSIHDKAFEALKKQISKAPVLKYFNVTKPVTLQCDASETGLGCALLQDGQPVAFASRTMTQTERRYAQIEKELLSILFGCNRFHQYIAGKEDISVETDHQPLVSIFKKSILSAPKRLQCMILKLQKFNITLTYKKGSKMYLADTLSRAAQRTSKNDREDLEAWQIHKIEAEEKAYKKLEEISSTENLNVTNNRLQQIKRETSKDKELLQTKEIILEGWPTTKEELPQDAKQYWTYRDELSVQDGLIFKGERLVVPKSLRKEMLKRIHASHQGIDASLRKAREILYWPHMSDDIKTAVSECSACQELTPSPAHLPMQTHRIPDLPWKRVAIDIFHHNENNYLVTVDYYSDYFELDLLPDLTSETVVETIKRNFSRHGCPLTVVTDNSKAQFITSNFTKFAEKWEFDHITSSPYHSRGNGKAESAVKIAKYLVKKTKRQSQDLWLALLEWRNTPTDGMDTSPAQRLMSRRTRTLLPVVKSLLKPKVETTVQEKLICKKRKYKSYYDQHSKPLPELEIGEGVLVKKPLKSEPKWIPGRILEKPSSRSYIVGFNGKEYRRNREYISKRISSPENPKSITSPKSTSPRERTPEVVTDNSNKPIEENSSQQKVINQDASFQTPMRQRTTRSGRPVKTPERYKQ